MALPSDPPTEFQRMWDGSEPGWKLVQYRHPVFLVEFSFDESGPTRSEFAAVLEFVGLRPGYSEGQMWDFLRGCNGIGISGPLGPSKMQCLRTWQRSHNLSLKVWTIQPDDYLILTPSGDHYGGWTTFPSARRAVVERMIAAGLPIVQGELEDNG